MSMNPVNGLLSGGQQSQAVQQLATPALIRGSSAPSSTSSQNNSQFSLGSIASGSRMVGYEAYLGVPAQALKGLTIARLRQIAQPAGPVLQQAVLAIIGTSALSTSSQNKGQLRPAVGGFSSIGLLPDTAPAQSLQESGLRPYAQPFVYNVTQLQLPLPRDGVDQWELEAARQASNERRATTGIGTAYQG